MLNINLTPRWRRFLQTLMIFAVCWTAAFYAAILGAIIAETFHTPEAFNFAIIFIVFIPVVFNMMFVAPVGAIAALILAGDASGRRRLLYGGIALALLWAAVDGYMRSV